ncbi:MAG: hypothetical protein ACOC8X_06045, partial [Chloroflexota bacterium]
PISTASLSSVSPVVKQSLSSANLDSARVHCYDPTIMKQYRVAVRFFFMGFAGAARVGGPFAL